MLVGSLSIELRTLCLRGRTFAGLSYEPILVDDLGNDPSEPQDSRVTAGASSLEVYSSIVGVSLRPRMFKSQALPELHFGVVIRIRTELFAFTGRCSSTEL